MKKFLILSAAVTALAAFAYDPYFPPETTVLAYQTCKQTATIKAALDSAMMQSISTGAALCICPTNLTVSITLEPKGKSENVLFGKIGQCSSKYTLKQKRVVTKIAGKNTRIGLVVHVAGLENYVNPTSISISSNGILQSEIIEPESLTFTYFFGPEPYVGDFPLTKSGNNYVCKQKIGDIEYNVKLNSKGALTAKLKAFDQLLQTTYEMYYE